MGEKSASYLFYLPNRTASHPTRPWAYYSSNTSFLTVKESTSYDFCFFSATSELILIWKTLITFICVIRCPRITSYIAQASRIKLNWFQVTKRRPENIIFTYSAQWRNCSGQQWLIFVKNVLVPSLQHGELLKALPSEGYWLIQLAAMSKTLSATYVLFSADNYFKNPQFQSNLRQMNPFDYTLLWRSGERSRYSNWLRDGRSGDWIPVTWNFPCR